MTAPSIDILIGNFDRALRVISGQARASRANPAASLEEATLSENEQKHAAGLMRVNHVGEICAQALYDSQAVFSRDQKVREQFKHSGIEEEDHLAWTAERLQQLNSHTSILNPIWYVGAYACGLAAGACGDAVSLGFVVETEKQVEAHLESHLEKLPMQDAKSRAIVDQMRIDEINHGDAASKLGAQDLPAPVKGLMKVMAKVMTSTAYHV
ncbi:2-polyprenyl-3-methyl-6-methoxy-1,4-benzoquinone monooxygenase [Undibacterium sp. LX40W]|uniref:3-demethoxyubiquinol 3-hydroxylase n=1 Tax=Undibacterium nitidum TaxID=2762298 RepID=A0A923KTZ8_9BURK|nr:MULTISPECIES: 2-polyprenyl-3-methyl-6-methoxy-1,4-benzoquinone monooxygenase [Undibacterium]MBC3881747.1 2-polyprenyl-3-methyl-6-methoxy-1,4-benzoquinone monooxygenase [Undibacterium nitidum]MBC3892256.1 2-polyprenyl-3-methyl-6-methoxy-1,4-benzoquinone monooxygenase [Undibacterium sp. LX40W]